MTDWLLLVAWLVMCAGLWGTIARDPITIGFCTLITVPYAIQLIWERVRSIRNPDFRN